MFPLFVLLTCLPLKLVRGSLNPKSIISKLYLYFYFWGRISLCSPGCPGSHYVDQAGLIETPGASFASLVLGSKVCTTTFGHFYIHTFIYLFIYSLFSCVWVFCLQVCLYTTYSVSGGQKRVSDPSGNAATNGFELPCGCLEIIFPNTFLCSSVLAQVY